VHLNECADGGKLSVVLMKRLLLLLVTCNCIGQSPSCADSCLDGQKNPSFMLLEVSVHFHKSQLLASSISVMSIRNLCNWHKIIFT